MFEEAPKFKRSISKFILNFGWPMKYLELVLVSFFCFTIAQHQAQTTVIDTFEHDGLMRDYILYLPANLQAEAPLVFNLHGYTSNADQQRFYSEMDDVADDNGFAVCYPDGTLDELGAPHWNSGWASGVDDTGFLVALAQSLQIEHDLDPERTFSCGMSNGGFMSYHLACEANDTFKAVASVTGSMSVLTEAGCDPSLAVPIFEIHGTLDLVVPYDGQDGILSIDDVVSFWANSNGCVSPDEYELDNTSLLDLCTVTVNKYTNCDSGNEVWLYTVNGGGHTWPGAIPIGVTGNTNQDFEASEEIWEFFNQYQPTVGVDDLVVNESTIYPNPAINRICGISGKFELWSISGSKVYSGMATEQCSEFSQLSPGLYIVKYGLNLSRSERLVIR